MRDREVCKVERDRVERLKSTVPSRRPQSRNENSPAVSAQCAFLPVLVLNFIYILPPQIPRTYPFLFLVFIVDFICLIPFVQSFFCSFIHSTLRLFILSIIQPSSLKSERVSVVCVHTKDPPPSPPLSSSVVPSRFESEHSPDPSIIFIFC